MPEMDGFEATVAIRRLEREAASGERVPRPGSTFAALPRHPLPDHRPDRSRDGQWSGPLPRGRDGCVPGPM